MENLGLTPKVRHEPSTAAAIRYLTRAISLRTRQVCWWYQAVWAWCRPRGSYNSGMMLWRRQPAVPKGRCPVADRRDPAGGGGLRRGLAVPCFADDPADLVQLGVGAERAGLDGYFLWDHLVHSDSGEGPPIVDPWQVLAVVAARTSRIKLGTMITPVARRRPWKLAKEVTTLDLLSGGRVILGVGLGDPAHAEFGLFGEPAVAGSGPSFSTKGWTSWRDCGPGSSSPMRGSTSRSARSVFHPARCSGPGYPSGSAESCRQAASWPGPPAGWPGCIHAAGRRPGPPAGTGSFPFTPGARETGPPSVRSRPLATRSRACGGPPLISISPCGVNSTLPGGWPPACPATAMRGPPGGWRAPAPGPAGWTRCASGSRCTRGTVPSWLSTLVVTRAWPRDGCLGSSSSALIPPCSYRPRQPITVGRDTPVTRAISAFGIPSAASSTIRARFASPDGTLGSRASSPPGAITLTQNQCRSNRHNPLSRSPHRKTTSNTRH